MHLGKQAQVLGQRGAERGREPSSRSGSGLNTSLAQAATSALCREAPPSLGHCPSIPPFPFPLPAHSPDFSRSLLWLWQGPALCPPDCALHCQDTFHPACSLARRPVCFPFILKAAIVLLMVGASVLGTLKTFSRFSIG